jgi:hypothetical protein
MSKHHLALNDIPNPLTSKINQGWNIVEGEMNMGHIWVHRDTLQIPQVVLAEDLMG